LFRTAEGFFWYAVGNLILLVFSLIAEVIKLAVLLCKVTIRLIIRVLIATTGALLKLGHILARGFRAMVTAVIPFASAQATHATRYSFDVLFNHSAKAARRLHEFDPVEIYAKLPEWAKPILWGLAIALPLVSTMIVLLKAWRR
jgi:hypothetical protein